MTFFTNSFKRSKSTSKYYNSLELEFFLLHHQIPPSTLSVSDLHFLTAHDTEEVSSPGDSSRQVSGNADTALLVQIVVCVSLGSSGTCKHLNSLEKTSLPNQSGVLTSAGLQRFTDIANLGQKKKRAEDKSFRSQPSIHWILIWQKHIFNLSPENARLEELNNPKILDSFTSELKEDS